MKKAMDQAQPPRSSRQGPSSVSPRRRLSKPQKIALIALAAVIVITALGVSLFFLSVRSHVLVIEDESISYDMVVQIVKTCTQGMSAEELADPVCREKVRAEAIDTLCKTYAPKILAARRGVTLSAEEKRAMKEEIAQIEALENFDALLAALHATKAVYEELTEIAYLDRALYASLTENAMGGRFASDNDTIDKDLAAGDWYAAEFAVFLYSAVNRETRREELESARELMLNGSSFAPAVESLRRKYLTDFSYLSDGCFTSTIYSETFEEIVKNLSVGEVSEICDTMTSDGAPCFVLIKRTAVTDDYIDENYETIIAYYLSREYYEYMSEFAATLSPELTWYYKDLDILDIEE